MSALPVLTDEVKLGKLPPAECKQLRALALALFRGEKLTPLTALQRYGVLSLSQRMGELKRFPYSWGIRSKMVKVGKDKHVMEYSL